MVDSIEFYVGKLITFANASLYIESHIFDSLSGGRILVVWRSFQFFSSTPWPWRTIIIDCLEEVSICMNVLYHIRDF